MTSLVDRDVDVFRTGFAGRVIVPGETGYDDARQVWNGQIDRSPAVIARCAGPQDVAAALKFAQQRGMEISVRGGAHNFGGAAVCDDGLMIDLSAMRHVTVFPGSRTAACGGGATWADVDAATQQHGLATPGGTISHTGIGGLTLGGGFGWLSQQYGLTCDNLVSAQVVTVNGEILRTSHDEHPELFWALRGGGGNFAVVTEFEFAVHPVGPVVDLGLFFWSLDDGPMALRLARDITENLPADMGALIVSLNAPPAGFVPDEHHFKPGYALVVAGFGSPDDHTDLARTIRGALPPLFELVTALKYTELQKMLDASAPWGILAYERAVYLDQLSDGAIDVSTEHVPKKQSAQSVVPIFPMGGAFRSMDEEATAFGGSRQTRIIFNATALAADPGLLDADRTWARRLCDALAPYAAGGGGYVNFLHDYAEGDRVRAAYGKQKYARLARIKAYYDPQNLLHRNPNIKPA